MSRDEDDKSTRLFDVRIIERNVRKGLTTRKDYDKYLKSLPDVSDKIAPPEALRPAVATPPPAVTMSMPQGGDSDDDLEDDIEDDDTEELTVQAVSKEGGAVGEADDDLDDDDLDEEDDDEDDIGTGGGPGPTA